MKTKSYTVSLEDGGLIQNNASAFNCGIFELGLISATECNVTIIGPDEDVDKFNLWIQEQTKGQELQERPDQKEK